MADARAALHTCIARVVKSLDHTVQLFTLVQHCLLKWHQAGSFHQETEPILCSIACLNGIKPDRFTKKRSQSTVSKSCRSKLRTVASEIWQLLRFFFSFERNRCCSLILSVTIHSSCVHVDAKKKLVSFCNYTHIQLTKKKKILPDQLANGTMRPLLHVLTFFLWVRVVVGCAAIHAFLKSK